MKKQVFLVVVLAALTAGGAFAAPEFKLSAGVGGLFDSDFGGGYKYSVESSGGGGNFDVTTSMPSFGGGGFAFFDATYAELSLGFTTGGGKVKEEYSDDDDPYTYDQSNMNLTIGLLGKYPFAVGSKLAVFPLLGIEYDVCLSVKAKGDNAPDAEDMPAAGDFNALWFKAGAGLDFAFTDRIYLRFEALYGIRLPNKAEKDAKAEVEDNSRPPYYVVSDAKTRLGHGLTAKLAVGFKF